MASSEAGAAAGGAAAAAQSGAAAGQNGATRVGNADPVTVMMAADAASGMLGITVAGHGEGWARTSMTVRPDMLNGHGMCHGGLIFALADTAFACACNSWGPVTVAADCDIVFVAPARAGDVLVAEARVRSRFGRSGIYDVTVRSGESLIAEFRGRSHETRAPGGPAPAMLALTPWHVQAGTLDRGGPL